MWREGDEDGVQRTPVFAGQRGGLRGWRGARGEGP